ncbi:hypothetical protein [Lutibacter sp.]|uniref:hypothetical protein n=1 Tax=Lutibacter sp. TaxID=1925666 RepID=UPI0025C12CC3|nr:hypothetical protein [Lutibacter sp.]MCF6181692.1 hypothetical protein [Lutibacter sp.]
MSYNTSNEFIVNQNTGLFKYDNKFYILNKENYRIIELTKEIFNKVAKNSTFRKNNNNEDVRFLVEKGILIIKNKIHEIIK